MDSVIVTLKWPNMAIETDIRCPANKPVDKLCVEILVLLREQYQGRLDAINSIKLQFNGKELLGDQTFASCGIWDGSYIFVR